MKSRKELDISLNLITMKVRPVEATAGRGRNIKRNPKVHPIISLKDRATYIVTAMARMIDITRLIGKY